MSDGKLEDGAWSVGHSSFLNSRVIQVDQFFIDLCPPLHFAVIVFTIVKFNSFFCLDPLCLNRSRFMPSSNLPPPVSSSIYSPRKRSRSTSLVLSPRRFFPQLVFHVEIGISAYGQFITHLLLQILVANYNLCSVYPKSEIKEAPKPKGGGVHIALSLTANFFNRNHRTLRLLHGSREAALSHFCVGKT